MFSTHEASDLYSVINAVPGNHLFLLADSPRFTIAGATDNYLQATFQKREGIVGKSVFDVLANDQEVAGATDENLRESLEYVTRSKGLHRMEDLQYQVLNAEGSVAEYRVWRQTNKAVADTEGRLKYIIHSKDDVTDEVKINASKLSIETSRKIEESEEPSAHLLKQLRLGLYFLSGVN